LKEEGEEEGEAEALRAPLMKEVSERFLVPITMLHNWRMHQGKIIEGRNRERKNKSEVPY